MKRGRKTFQTGRTGSPPPLLSIHSQSQRTCQATQGRRDTQLVKSHLSAPGRPNLGYLLGYLSKPHLIFAETPGKWQAHGEMSSTSEVGKVGCDGQGRIDGHQPCSLNQEGHLSTNLPNGYPTDHSLRGQRASAHSPSFQRYLLCENQNHTLRCKNENIASLHFVCCLIFFTEILFSDSF